MTAKHTKQKVLTYTDTYKLIRIFVLHETFKQTIVMKTSLVVLFFCIILIACSSNEKSGNIAPINPEQAHTEIKEKKFPKAACILWIDKNKEKTLMNKVVRNIKAKVHINELGKITVLEYEKTPHFILEEKINLCLKTYRVTPEVMEKGNLKEGENIVFLRFVERELKPE